jgi:hypothetical protein
LKRFVLEDARGAQERGGEAGGERQVVGEGKEEVGEGREQVRVLRVRYSEDIEGERDRESSTAEEWERGAAKEGEEERESLNVPARTSSQEKEKEDDEEEEEEEETEAERAERARLEKVDEESLHVEMILNMHIDEVGGELGTAAAKKRERERERRRRRWQREEEMAAAVAAARSSPSASRGETASSTMGQGLLVLDLLALQG